MKHITLNDNYLCIVTFNDGLPIIMLYKSALKLCSNVRLQLFPNTYFRIVRSCLLEIYKVRFVYST